MDVTAARAAPAQVPNPRTDWGPSLAVLGAATGSGSSAGTADWANGRAVRAASSMPTTSGAPDPTTAASAATSTIGRAPDQAALDGAPACTTSPTPTAIAAIAPRLRRRIAAAVRP